MTPRLIAAVRALAVPPEAAADADLLRRVAAGDDAAFMLVVGRHGPMVWSVCRNLLPAEADAEDAFQATFLALVRNRGSLSRVASVGAWLHGAAGKISLKIRRTAARRRKRETAAARPEGNPPAIDWADSFAAVHAEVEALPPRERAVFVLCGLQGVRQADAAVQLGMKVNTVSGLLSRGRAKVLAKLAARGLAPAVAAGFLGGAAGPVPAAAFAKAVELARAADAVPGFLIMLARGATEGTTMAKKLWAAAVITAGTAVGGWALVPANGQGPGPGGVAPAGARPPAAAPPGGSPGGFSPVGQPPGASGFPGGPPGGMMPPGGPGGRGGAASGPGEGTMSGGGMGGMPGGMGPGGGMPASRGKFDYKLVEVPGVQSADEFRKILAENDADGWEYAGGEELKTAAARGDRATHHVIFKRPKPVAVPAAAGVRADVQLQLLTDELLSLPGRGGPGVAPPTVKPAEIEVATIRLKSADATTALALLTTWHAQTKKPETLSMACDANTNSIVLMGAPAAVKATKVLIAALDKSAEGVSSRP